MCLVAICQSMAQVLYEDFSSGTEGQTFPNGWTTSVEAGFTGNWVVGNTANTGIPAYGGDTGMINGGCDGLYALLDSDGLGSTFNQNSSLISPVIDLSGYTDLILKFNHHFRVYNSNADYGYVEASINGGSTWQNITTFTGAQNYVAEGLTTVDISAFAGNPAVQIRFRYVGAWGYYWGIDNVEVTQCTVSQPTAVTVPTLPLDAATDVQISYNGDTNGDGTDDNTISFEWPSDPADEINSYTFNLGLTPNGNDIGSLSVGTNTVSLIYAWTESTTYYWSVDATNCAGSTTGTVFSFTTGACNSSLFTPVTNPTLPLNASIDVPIQYGADTDGDGTDDDIISFEWPVVDGASDYTFNLGTTPNGNDIGSLTVALNTVNLIYTWAEGTTYYWSIDTSNCAGTSAGSVFSFTTASCSSTVAPSQVSLSLPANGSAVALDNSDPDNPNSTSFSWDDNDDSQNFYTLYLADNEALLNASVFNNFNSGDQIINLTDNSTYYWKIESYNCFGFTSSETWSFTTSTTAGLNDMNQNLFSVFPNPVENIINIKGNGVIDNLEVLNQLGQRVLAIDGSLLTNKQLNISSLESGLYFIRLTANNKTEILQVIKQ